MQARELRRDTAAGSALYPKSLDRYPSLVDLPPVQEEDRMIGKKAARAASMG
jgi:hypothetical protein